MKRIKPSYILLFAYIVSFACNFNYFLTSPKTDTIPWLHLATSFFYIGCWVLYLLKEKKSFGLIMSIFMTVISLAGYAIARWSLDVGFFIPIALLITYYEGGYPPEDVGVCTDVVWRAFKNAGYSLRDMVDQDIKVRPETYPKVEKPDNNIDFRRVRNLRIFFEKYASSLTLDINEIAEWQPGDIVIFGDDKHIGIISDKRNRYGQPYVIHNAGQPNREEDYLSKSTVTGHYRFDASRVDNEVSVKWK